MLKYRVASGSSPAELASRVNKLIGEGWEPQGGIGVRSWVQTEDKEGSFILKVAVHHAELLQAMVLEK